MAEHDDINLDDEFAALRGEILHRVTPAGPAAVRTRVRQRRRRAAVTTGALAVLLVAAPVAGYAALNRDPVPRPGPAVTVEPTTPPTPTPSPSASASPSVASAPDGRISRTELLRTKIDLPSWPESVCGTSQVQLAATGSRGWTNVLLGVEYGDVDRDGADETLVMVRCNVGEPGPIQVVALDRNTAGRIVTLGQVVKTGPRDVANMFAIDPQPNGSVRVQVGDHGGCCGYRAEWIQRQWRTYSLAEGGFSQVGGLTSFRPNPNLADIRVTTTDVTIKDEPGLTLRHGTVTVTIRNAGPVDVDGVQLGLYLNNGWPLRAEGSGWSACTSRGHQHIAAKPPVCGLGPLRSGQQRTLVLGISWDKGGAASGTGTAQVRRLDHGPDRDEANNYARFSYR